MFKKKRSVVDQKPPLPDDIGFALDANGNCHWLVLPPDLPWVESDPEDIDEALRRLAKKKRRERWWLNLDRIAKWSFFVAPPTIVITSFVVGSPKAGLVLAAFGFGLLGWAALLPLVTDERQAGVGMRTTWTIATLFMVGFAAAR